ncbi:hypothetical protein SDC9_152642 [bioreactor metagenome]|uniref:Uncharacterized protein n=1 Tax=bioreactor metagenome TaxID=1076179 RepID=A0A645EVY8_9ZZZZ
MTQVWFKQKGDYFSVKVEGHSCYTPARGVVPDGDIVCSACSILAFTLLQCILTEEADGGLYAFESSNGDGRFSAEFRCVERKIDKIRTIFDTIISGYRLLHDSYPQNVEIFVQTREKR